MAVEICSVPKPVNFLAPFQSKDRELIKSNWVTSRSRMQTFFMPFKKMHSWRGFLRTQLLWNGKDVRNRFLTSGDSQRQSSSRPISSATSRILSQTYDEPQSEAQLEVIRRSVMRGYLRGDEVWSSKMVVRFGLENIFRVVGRPKHTSNVF